MVDVSFMAMGTFMLILAAAMTVLIGQVRQLQRDNANRMDRIWAALQLHGNVLSVVPYHVDEFDEMRHKMDRLENAMTSISRKSIAVEEIASKRAALEPQHSSEVTCHCLSCRLDRRNCALQDLDPLPVIVPVHQHRAPVANYQPPYR